MEKHVTNPGVPTNDRKLLAVVVRFATLAALVQVGIMIAVLLVGWLTGW